MLVIVHGGTKCHEGYFSLMVMKCRLFVELGLRFSFALLVLLTVRRHVEKLNFDMYS